MRRKILIDFLTRKGFLLLLFLMSAVFVQAQSFRDVSGLIKDGTGEPVIGVNVTVKGDATTGTISDVDGRYHLRLPQQRVTLVFSFIGYKTQEKVLDANVNTLDVTLVEDNEMLDEVVVVGYGTMKRKDLTGSVSHIGDEVTKNRVATNALDFLSGSIAGVNLTPSADAAGGGVEQEVIGGEAVAAREADGAGVDEVADVGAGLHMGGGEVRSGI